MKFDRAKEIDAWRLGEEALIALMDDHEAGVPWATIATKNGVSIELVEYITTQVFVDGTLNNDVGPMETIIRHQKAHILGGIEDKLLDEGMSLPDIADAGDLLDTKALSE